MNCGKQKHLFFFLNFSQHIQQVKTHKTKYVLFDITLVGSVM